MKRKRLEQMQELADKYWDNYQLLNHWLAFKNENKSPVLYFEEEGLYHIAVYGMGDLAMRFMEELKGSRVTVEYGIDQNVCSAQTGGCTVYSLEQKLPEVQAVVVTPFYAYDTIKGILERKAAGRIISLEEVIWSI